MQFRKVKSELICFKIFYYKIAAYIFDRDEMLKE